MKKLLSPLALLGSAAVVALAACSSTSDGPLSPNARAPLANLGTASVGQVQVCLAAGIPAGSYTFTTTQTNAAAPASQPDQVNSPVTINTTDVQKCQVVFTRSYTVVAADGTTSGPIGTVSITASGPAGTFTYTCSEGAAGLCGGSLSGTNPAAAAASAFHGSLVTFNFVPTVTPPPPPPSIATPIFVIGDVELHTLGTDVNFWGAQWWKNNDMSGFVSNGISGGSFKGYASSADNFCGGTWTSRVGNSPPPPESIGSTINIIVTSTITKNGPNIGGNIVQILTVTNDGGYAGNPGHAGNGVVTQVLCPVATAGTRP